MDAQKLKKVWVRQGWQLTEIRIVPKFLYSQDDVIKFMAADPLPKQGRTKPWAVVWAAWPKYRDDIGQKNRGREYSAGDERIFRRAVVREMGPFGKRECLTFMWTIGADYPIRFWMPTGMGFDGVWVRVERGLPDPLPQGTPHASYLNQGGERPGWTNSGMHFDETLRVSKENHAEIQTT